MDRNLRRNTLILVSALAAILVVYLIAFLIPQRRRADDLRAEIRRKKESISQCRQRADQQVMYDAELAMLQTANQRAMEQIPNALNVKEFLATVHSLGHQAGITISNVTPGIVSEVVSIQQQPISLALVGRFTAIMRLVYDLETMGRIVELTDLDIRSLDKTAALEDTLEVKLTIRLFAQPPKSAPPTQTNG
jgi:Tfp pilus assembly protein PilO